MWGLRPARRAADLRTAAEQCRSSGRKGKEREEKERKKERKI